MTVRVRLFAMMAAGNSGNETLELQLPDGATVAGARQELVRLRPQLKWPVKTMVAVNMEYAGEQTPLHDRDEVAIIPPVSGG